MFQQNNKIVKLAGITDRKEKKTHKGFVAFGMMNVLHKTQTEKQQQHLIHNTDSNILHKTLSIPWSWKTLASDWLARDFSHRSESIMLMNLNVAMKTIVNDSLGSADICC